jgi:5-methylcytosine-specific restriction endonuclease McrA
MPDVRPDPKPETVGGIGRKKPPKGWRTRGRVVASPKKWEALRTAKLGECRVCGGERQARNGTLTMGLHHLVFRSHGGDDVEDNLVPLHNVCHDEIHARNPESLQLLAESLTDAEYAYIIGKLGEGGMSRLFGVLT